MATKLGKHFNTKKTPQTQPIPGKEKKMVKGASGGYLFQVNDFQRLERFLVLGTDGGTYYSGEKELTIENAQCVARCLSKDPIKVIYTIVAISDSGRAFKNDPALFALAMASAKVFNPDDLARAKALAALPKVARIPTHLFHYVDFMTGFRGWAVSNRRAVANWYLNHKPETLAMHLVKYQGRDGWSNSDLLRLSHPKPLNPEQDLMFRWVTQGKDYNHDETISKMRDYDNLKIIPAFEEAVHLDVSVAKQRKHLVKLIQDFRLPHECVPTQAKQFPEVWEALLMGSGKEKDWGMPIGAMIRNLGKMTQIELLKPMSKASKFIIQKLADVDQISRSRLHPLSILLALITYNQGHGVKGSLNWTPVQSVVDALDEAFYLAFGNVEPTGKNLVFGLDVSPSMIGSYIAGTFLSCRQATAALALVTARVEKEYVIKGFAQKLVDVKITPKMRLDDAIKEIGRYNYGGTDASLPIRWALDNKIECDAFLNFTDSESWAGPEHTVQSLNNYRKWANKDVKMVVASMTSNHVSVADPDDRHSLDIVGFDTNCPQLISDFVAGRV